MPIAAGDTSKETISDPRYCAIQPQACIRFSCSSMPVSWYLRQSRNTQNQHENYEKFCYNRVPSKSKLVGEPDYYSASTTFLTSYLLLIRCHRQKLLERCKQSHPPVFPKPTGQPKKTKTEPIMTIFAGSCLLGFLFVVLSLSWSSSWSSSSSSSWYSLISYKQPVQWGLLAAGSLDSSGGSRSSPRRSTAETDNNYNDYNDYNDDNNDD